MFVFYEYLCKGIDCPVSKGVDEDGRSIWEAVTKMVTRGAEDLEECENCHRVMERIISAPKGIVRGTDNPVKFKR